VGPLHNKDLNINNIPEQERLSAANIVFNYESCVKKEVTGPIRYRKEMCLCSSVEIGRRIKKRSWGLLINETLAGSYSKSVKQTIKIIRTINVKCVEKFKHLNSS
jgi:hypothetical protein